MHHNIFNSYVLTLIPTANIDNKGDKQRNANKAYNKAANSEYDSNKERKTVLSIFFSEE